MIEVFTSGNPPDISSGSIVFSGPRRSVSFGTTSTTGFPIADSQVMDPIRDPSDSSITWITVIGNDEARFMSLAELRVEAQA